MRYITKKNMIVTRLLIFFGVYMNSYVTRCLQDVTDEPRLLFRQLSLPARGTYSLILQTILAPSAISCVLQCLKEKRCVTTGFNRNSTECRLFGYSPEFTTIRRTDDIYYEIVMQFGKHVYKGRCDESHTGQRLIYDCSRLDFFLENCMAFLQSGFKRTGLYNIKRTGLYNIKSRYGQYLPVYCDMETDGGGWVVFQMRFNGSVRFRRTWEDYEKGFGTLYGEFWLGLEHVNRLTKTYSEMRVELEAWSGKSFYRQYKDFKVDERLSGYRLHVSKNSYGTASDALRGVFLLDHHHQPFSTFDHDYSNGCPQLYNSSWWSTLHPICHSSDLNGEYKSQANTTFGQGLAWYMKEYNYHYSFRKTQMKLRSHN